MTIDSHVDTPSQLMRYRNIGIDNPYAHVDFPKMKAGAVDGAFFALYTPASMTPDTATRYALEMISAVYDAVDENADCAALAFTPQDAVENQQKGLISVFMGMENGAPIQESLPLLRTFYRLGVSYLTLTHNGDNALADSAAEGKTWNGLSPFGRQLVAEMNALGMMIDLSHASDKTFWDCIEVSKAPIIATHSCCRALCGHRRNLSDEMLQALGEKGGYVGINFYPSFLSDRFAANAEDAARMDKADEAEAAFIADPLNPRAIQAWNEAQDELKKLWRPGVKEIVDHIDHAVRWAGIEHVGIGSDFDGIQVPPQGVENMAFMGRIWDEMRLRGYSEKQISRVSGQNLLDAYERIIKCSELIS